LSPVFQSVLVLPFHVFCARVTCCKSKVAKRRRRKFFHKGHFVVIEFVIFHGCKIFLVNDNERLFKTVLAEFENMKI
jgi:hypothetical protein